MKLINLAPSCNAFLPGYCRHRSASKNEVNQLGTLGVMLPFARLLPASVCPKTKDEVDQFGTDHLNVDQHMQASATNT
jgi:hypothetical protein